MNKVTIVAALGAALMLGWAAGAPGQAPALPRAVTLVVPDAAGSAADIVARTLAPALGNALGTLVAVSDRPGGNEAAGAEVVAKAAPDGATLLLASGTFAAGAGLQAALAYDPVKSFAPVGLVAATPYVLVAATTLPLDTVQDVIAIAKANPGRLHYAATGRGTPSHLAGEMLKSLATVQLTQAPYKDAAAALSDVAAGKVQLYFAPFPEVQPLVKAGKIRALAVTGPRRLAQAPDVPTMLESGVVGFDVVQWFGVLAPAATPKATVERLNAALRRALQVPEVRERLAAQLAAETSAGTPDALDALLRREIATWAKLAREMNLKPE
jgi:tripartite-type tricarboxylate transporter receptor subunit TctC